VWIVEDQHGIPMRHSIERGSIRTIWITLLLVGLVTCFRSSGRRLPCGGVQLSFATVPTRRFRNVQKSQRRRVLLEINSAVPSLFCIHKDQMQNFTSLYTTFRDTCLQGCKVVPRITILCNFNTQSISWILATARWFHRYSCQGLMEH
jgi:hypothetical protein